MKQYLDMEFRSEDGICQFADIQVQDAVHKLEKYISLMQNDNRIFEKGVNLTLNGDYNNVSLKRSTIIDSKIQEVNFGNAALTSSYFSNTYLCDSIFNESNMQYCQFIQNTWENTIVQSTNLSYSNFYGVTFKNVTFKGSTVAEILFEKCNFENCKFISSMMENTVFLCCTFQDVIFSNSNIEYMELKNCKLINVCFPMSQFPYVYAIDLSILTNKTNLLRQWHNKKTHTKMGIQPTFCLYLLCGRCFGKVFLAYLN